MELDQQYFNKVISCSYVLELVGKITVAKHVEIDKPNIKNVLKKFSRKVFVPLLNNGTKRIVQI